MFWFLGSFIPILLSVTGGQWARRQAGICCKSISDLGSLWPAEMILVGIPISAQPYDMRPRPVIKRERLDWRQHNFQMVNLLAAAGRLVRAKQSRYGLRFLDSSSLDRGQPRHHDHPRPLAGQSVGRSVDRLGSNSSGGLWKGKRGEWPAGQPTKATAASAAAASISPLFTRR